MRGGGSRYVGVCLGENLPVFKLQRLECLGKDDLVIPRPVFCDINTFGEKHALVCKKNIRMLIYNNVTSIYLHVIAFTSRYFHLTGVRR